MKYRIDGREKKLGIGTYPEIGLGDARKRRDEARELLAIGKDPSREKQQAKIGAKVSAANTFGEIAKEYIDKRRREGLSTSTAEKSEYYISRMSENTINAGLRRLGFTGDEMTAHGFRAMASTLLNESGEWHPDAIERALAHGDENKVRAAYHRGARWKERVEMAQWWSDHLDQLRRGAKILRRDFERSAS